MDNLINKQREIIKDFGYVQDSLDYFAIDSLSETWKLSEYITNYLGDAGKVSFPATFKGLQNKGEEDLVKEKRHRLNALIPAALLTYSYSIPCVLEFMEIDDYRNLCDEYRKVNLYSSYVTVNDNKVNLHAGELSFDKGDFIELETLKSFNKTFNRMLALRFGDRLSEVKPIIEPFIKEIEKARIELEQLVSRNYTKNGTLYISGLPEDILTASVNSQGWRSCFAPDGEYSATPFHYLRSERTMIAYFVADTSDKFKYEGHMIDDKMWRTWIFECDGGIAFSSQQYPSYSKEVEDVLYSKIIDLNPNLEIMEDINTSHMSEVYWDGCVKKALVEEGIKSLDIDVSYNTCFHTGSNLNFISSEYQCMINEDHLGLWTCSYCGDQSTGDYSTDIDENTCLCEYCLEEEFVFSEYRQTYIENSEAIPVYEYENFDVFLYSYVSYDDLETIENLYKVDNQDFRYIIIEDDVTLSELKEALPDLSLLEFAF